MINRLQFVHNSDLFNTREEAINFLNNTYYRQVTRPSLYAEPVVLKYGNAESPNIILAIGSRGNGISPSEDSSYFIIDVQGIKDDIEDKYEDIQNAMEKLAFAVSDTKTLTLSKTEKDGKVTLDGNVRIPEKVALGDYNVKNIIKTNDDGIYTYVNLAFDDTTNTFSFQVNDDVKEFSIPVIESGRYDVKKEAIVLTFTDGSTTDVDVDDLINEWTTEGEESSTPIVLTKERHRANDGKDKDDWKDILKADVRIWDDEKHHNILKTTNDGKRLYVMGTADNIFYKDNKTVKDAIDSIKTEVSTATTNNIIFKSYSIDGDYNGIAASVDMEYDKKTNVLVMKCSKNDGTIERKEFKLNSASFIDDISYDTRRQTITIRYKDEDGVEQKTDIELSDLLDDWEVQNEGHNVALAKQVVTDNKDTLSADVKILAKKSDNHQILEDIGHSLYVKGTADNIYYSDDENVEDAIGRISNEIKTTSDEIKADVDKKIEDVTLVGGSTKTAYVNIDNKKINVDVKIASGDRNRIQYNDQGLYVGDISATYNSSTNTLTINGLDGKPVFSERLNSASFIKEIRYDDETYKLHIIYELSDGGTVDVPIDLKSLIIDTKADETSNTPIKVTVTRSMENNVSVNKIKADVNIADNVETNILKRVSDNNGGSALIVDTSDFLKKVNNKLINGGETNSVSIFSEKDDVANSYVLKADVKLATADNQNKDELTKTEIPNADDYEGNLLQIVKTDSVQDDANGLYFGGSIDYGEMKGIDDIYDYNNDGVVDAEDVDFLKKVVSGSETLPDGKIGDINKDGYITKDDVVLLKNLLSEQGNSITV